MDEKILVSKNNPIGLAYMCWHVFVDTKNDHKHKTLVPRLLLMSNTCEYNHVFVEGRKRPIVQIELIVINCIVYPNYEYV